MTPYSRVLSHPNIELELKEKQELIKELEALLANPKKMLKVISDELVSIKEKYSISFELMVLSKNSIYKVFSIDSFFKCCMVISRSFFTLRLFSISFCGSDIFVS